MKLKEKLGRDFSKHRAEERKKRFPNLNPAGFENERQDIEYGFIAGFEKAKALLNEKMNSMADWSFESFNMGDMTIEECRTEELKLRHWARIVERLGEEEVSEEK